MVANGTVRAGTRARAGTEPEPEFEPEPLPWRSEDQSWRGAAPANEFELNPTRVNGGSEHEPHDFASQVSSKSLEDSVKEMLRPLLRQWLDENTSRIFKQRMNDKLGEEKTQQLCLSEDPPMPDRWT